MDLWLETIGVFGIAAVGMALGHWASRSGVFSRTSALVITFALVGLVLLGHFPSLVQRWPVFYPLAAGRVRFVLLAFAVTLGLSTPLAQLTRPTVRMLTCVIMALYVAALTILPFVGPAAVQGQLAELQTEWDTDGVCRQTLPFTCAAAAATTALDRLGIAAEKGELAVAVRTSPVIGASVWTLYRVLRQRYEPQGVSFSFVLFDTLEAVPHDGVMLAVMRDSVLGDHCVAVLEVSAHEVVIADPARGRVRLSTAEFLRTWRGSGIVLRKPLSTL